ncbi:MAG TPA: patatin-like phospholipase family protein [Microthrixaceae bacterium]|nr:patatin-like phospholipase family protein [Microthrixaceae bacterium]HMT24878.1 patatin-like phospholipase family protein [Microthrixaceae bacterium]
MPTPHEIATRRAPKPTRDLREPRLAIALSGGGYRAMLFHLGALKRLNEFGLLSVMDRMSTVSGGSITGAVLAIRWPDLNFDAAGVAAGFDRVEKDVFEIADRTIDIRSGILGLLPGTTGAAQVAKALDGPLDHKMLADVPGERPRFTFNTTNMQSGNLFRWSSSYAADWELGQIVSPNISLATVIAASAAFPPILSPLRISVPGTLVDFHSTAPAPVMDPPDRLWLTDGGVYDNLGIENLKSFHTVLASDGGAPFASTTRLRANIGSQALRTMFLLNEQVGRQRKRGLVHELQTGQRLGALWTISTKMADYTAGGTLPCPDEAIVRLAAVRTRLKRLPRQVKYQLANWGYASADAAVRSFVEPTLPPPVGFPYPGGVG